MFITTIGSRKTPDSILADMIALGRELASRRFTGRSGHAQGADQAFETGFNGQFEIYLPWVNFEADIPCLGKVFIPDSDPRALEIASKIHPNWSACSYGAKSLHARNINQVLGANLDAPSSYLICWTKNGKVTGGSATAINLAIQRNIPVFNLALMSSEEILKRIDEA